MSHSPSPHSTLSPSARQQLLQTRTRRLQYGLLRHALLLLLQGFAVLGVVGTIDYIWPTPLLVRAGALLALLALVVRRAWLTHIDQRQIDDLTTAQLVEAAHPMLGQRLRTAYQYSAANAHGHAPALTDALIDDTNRRADQVDFTTAVCWSRLVPYLATCAATVLLLLGVLACWRETRTTLARLLLVPTDYTKLRVTAPEPVPAGSDVMVVATVAGRPVDRVELYYRPKTGGAWSKQTMLPSSSGAADQPDGERSIVGQVSARLERCEQDLDLQIVTAPVSSGIYQLQVLQPLTQESFAAQVEPPSYTGEPAATFESMDVTLVEGALVSWQLRLNREPAEVKLVQVQPPADAAMTPPLPPVEIQGSSLNCDLGQLDQSATFEVRATAADGMQFTSAPLKFRVKKDQGPVVKFKQPNEQVEVTPTTEVALQLDASDDFGLTRVGVEYQINGGEKQVLWAADVRGAERHLASMPVLYLEDHALAQDDAVTYYAFAEDNRAQPRRSRSELRFIDIRPYKREYQFVDGNCQGGGGACLSLEEIIARQRQNLRNTFANLDRQPVQDRLAGRLSRSQQQVLAATRDFAAGWEQRFGPLPTLHQAATAMEAAVAQLESKSLDAAMPQQEVAVAQLVAARQNLRKFLKTCSSGQLGQCQKYDNEMMQQLRRPRPKQQQRQESLAETTRQLQDLAQNQRQWSEQVRTYCGSGAQFEREPSSQKPSTRPAGQNKPGQAAQSSSSKQPQSASQLAQAQQQAADTAQQLQQALGATDTASPLSEDRMREIAAEIARSGQEVQSGEGALTAAKRAEDAARMLDQLVEHLQGLSSADIAQRLALAEQLASRLQAGESDVANQLREDRQTGQAANTELAETQGELARQTETLADVLKHLEGEALGDAPALRSSLAELQDVHQPQQLAQEMAGLVEPIRSGRREQAAGGTRAAATSLSRLASELGALRRDVLQPKLDELLAAEVAAAELLQRIHGAHDTSEQAEIVARFQQLERQLAALHLSALVEEAAEEAATQQSGSSSGGPQRQSPGAASQSARDSAAVRGTEPQFSYAGRSVNAEVRRIVNVLQTRIQDAILLTARMDADEPVPAKYRALVDEYYQTISDDLR